MCRQAQAGIALMHRNEMQNKTERTAGSDAMLLVTSFSRQKAQSSAANNAAHARARHSRDFPDG